MAPVSVLLLHPSADWYGADRQLLTLATGLDPARYRPLVVLPELGALAVALEDAGVEVVVAAAAALGRSPRIVVVPDGLPRSVERESRAAGTVRFRHLAS